MLLKSDLCNICLLGGLAMTMKNTVWQRKSMWIGMYTAGHKEAKLKPVMPSDQHCCCSVCDAHNKQCHVALKTEEVRQDREAVRIPMASVSVEKAIKWAETPFLTFMFVFPMFKIWPTQGLVLIFWMLVIWGTLTSHHVFKCTVL